MAHEATVDGVDPDEDAHEDEAYAALDQMLASQREALREALEAGRFAAFAALFRQDRQRGV